MAATALGQNREPISIRPYHRELEELAHVINHHSSRFHRIALSHLGNVADAEDAVQDAVLLALRHVDQFRGQAKLSTWLTTIVINSARMKLRRRSVQKQISLDETSREQNLPLADLVPDTRPDPERSYQNQEIATTLAQGTSQLSPSLRRTFQLRDIHGLSIRETAHLMGVPAGTVKARLARARMGLRKVMGRSRGQNCH
jgi:RNA polymerase sigma-70 factor, ECF subfamily